jgi:hypothetical protein
VTGAGVSGRGRTYPAHWKTLSRKIRYERAKGRCECEGECGLHRTHPGPRRCEEMDQQAAKWAKGTVVLTVAHLCRDSTCDDETHLKAMCNRCHLRYDVKQHVTNAYQTRRAGAAHSDLFSDEPA